MALLYSQVLQSQTVARCPMNYEKQERKRQKIIHRLAIIQDKQRVLDQFETSDAVVVEGKLFTLDEYDNYMQHLAHKSRLNCIKNRIEKRAREVEEIIPLYIEENRFSNLPEDVDEIGREYIPDLSAPSYMSTQYFREKFSGILGSKGICLSIRKNFSKLRSCMLAYKLKYMIRELVSLRATRDVLEMYRVSRDAYMAEWYQKAVEYPEINRLLEWDDNEFATPEMDRPEGGEEVVEQASNVVLGETNEESVDIASKPYQPSWDQLSSSEVLDQYNALTDRWLLWKSLVWDSNDTAYGKRLLTEKFPQAWVQMDTNKERNPRYINIPNFIPFQIHQYMRADFEIKIYINPNDFVSGWLIMAFLYQGSEMSDYLVRRTPEALIQMPHVLVNVGAANEATLTVPYRYVRPFMRCKDILSDSAENEPLNMGVLTVAVLVPLRTSAAKGAPKQVNFSLFVKMNNAKFTGMVDGSISTLAPATALPEMDRILDNGIGLVSSLLKDVNCDNPPDPRPPSFFVPIPSHSWSHGTGTSEPINTLRLSGGVIGVGRSEDIGTSDTGIAGINSVFGLLKSFDWDSTDGQNVAGRLLWAMPVHPQVDKDKVRNIDSITELTGYYLPPVSVVSSLYAYWRGSLKFKFLFGTTARHNARILVAYIPGVGNGEKVTLERARNSAHVVFSLNETSEFTFIVPYIADVMWWPRKYGGPQSAGEFIAPSYLCMFIVNPLVAMESVPNIVTVQPMIAAGDDFEVAIPAQPAIGLTKVRKVIYPSNAKIQFLSSYYPVYIGNWHSFVSGTKLIMRYGAVSDHVAQVTPRPIGVEKTAIFRIEDFDSNLVVETDIPQVKLSKAVYPIGYGVMWTDGGYNYLIPYPAEAAAKQAAEQVARLLAEGRDIAQLAPYIPNYYRDSQYSKGNVTWDAINDRLRRSWDLAEPEMERTVAPNVMQPTSLLPSTSNGRVIFGESFVDLKDLARRYQLYWEGTVREGNLRSVRRNSALVQIPLYPHGLRLQPSLVNPVWNSMRDGHIPVISSGFRYFRGGMRMRIVISGLEDSVWVQHHPDRLSNSDIPVVGKQIADRDAYRNHGYAFYIQNMSVNKTIEIEVPFYQPGLYGMLHSIPGEVANAFDQSRFTGLGDLIIGIEGEQSIPANGVDITVYYSLADDCSFNIFCGFPPMVYCDEAYSTAVPEMAEPEMMSALTNIVGGFAGTQVYNLTNLTTKNIENKVRKVVANEFKTQIKPELDNLNSVLGKAADDIGKTYGNVLPQQLMMNALGQLVQVFNNPTPGALAIAVMSFVSSLVTFSMEIMTLFTDKLKNTLEELWNRYFARATELQAAGPSAVPEGFWDEAEDKSVHGILGLLFTVICTSLGLTIAPPKSFPNVMKGVRESLNVANASVTFFRNIVDSVKYLYTYCLGAGDEELQARIIVEREYPQIKNWFDEATKLLDPRSRNVIEHDSRQATRVFDCCMYGAKIIQANIDKNMPGGRVIYDVYTKLTKLRDEIIELGNHPDVRFEAFPLYIVGKAGIGKTYLTQEVCKRMLEAIDYKTKETMIYWLSLGQKYWNGIRNPPVIARDEAYAISGQFTEEEIAVHLAMCSCSILNPPMAAISEKNKRLNPLIYYMNSNVPFPSLPEARHVQAIYRRRKLLVDADFTEEIMNKYPNVLDASELPAHERENFNHLRFRIARDPKNPATTWSEWMSFDAYMNILIPKFTSHIESERANFKNRMRAAYALDPDYRPNDNLLYINPSSGLSHQTLHEQYIEERARARLYITEIENPFNEEELREDPWLTQIVNKFKHLFKLQADCEMDLAEMSDQPQCSAGVKVMRDFLINTCGMRKDAAVLLAKGRYNFTEQEGAEFILPEEYHWLKNQGFELAAAILTDEMSCLPNGINASYRRMGNVMNYRCMNDIGNSKYPTINYANLGGIDQIRSYCYWWLRSLQLRSLRKIIKQHNYKEWAETKLFKLSGNDGPYMAEWRRALIKIRDSSEDELLKSFEVLDRATTHSVNDVCEGKGVYQMLILTLLTDLTDDYRDVFCEHCKVFVEYLDDLSVVEYSERHKTLRYPGNFGCMRTVSSVCNCENSIFSNRLFQNAMRMLWNHDHPDCSAHTRMNPFSWQEFDTTPEIESFFSKIYDWCKDWWKTIALPAVGVVLRFLYEHWFKVVAALLSLLYLYNMFSPVKTVSTMAAADTVVKTASWLVPEGSVYLSGDRVVKAHHGTMPANRESTEEQMRIAENKVVNNMCFLVCTWIAEDGFTRTLRARCLAVKGRDIIVIKHYLQEFLSHPNATYMLGYRINGVEANAFIDVSVIKNMYIYRIGNSTALSNIALIKLPKHVPMFKNILNNIASQTDHANSGHFCSLVSANYDEPAIIKPQVAVNWRSFLTIAGDHNVEQITMDKCYEYGIRGRGLCGSALISPGVCRGNGGVIGLHVAGEKGSGFSEPIYREMFEPVLDKDSPEISMPVLEDISKANVNLDNNLILYGCVSDALSHKESGQTKIIPSEIHGQVYDVKTEPNPLRPNDPRQPPGSHPLRDGCAKHGSGMIKPFPSHIMTELNADARNILVSEVKNPLAVIRTLTRQEQVCGSKSIPHCESLNWNSSEGFPLCNRRPAGEKGKKWLFDMIETDDGYVLRNLDPQLALMLSTRKRMRDQNIVSPPIYIDCLKDFRLPPEKCAIRGKTRIFSIAPVQTTLELREYLGLFLSGYKSATIRAEHGIGINPDSMQWTQLANYMHEVGDNIVAGDYSNFGPCVSSQIVQSCIEDIIYWHEVNGATPLFLRHLRLLLEFDILNPIHLCGNLVYQTLNGIASGSPITAELNSEVAKKYIKGAFLLMSEQNKTNLSLLDFHKNCRLVVYGDDLFLSVSNSYIDWFNCETISNCLREYGINLTDINKDGKFVKKRSLTEATFLKRGFKSHPFRVGVYLAPIEEQSYQECINWCHKQKDLKAATSEVMRASCDLAFGHGPIVYEHHVKKLHSIAARKGLEFNCNTWQLKDAECFGYL